MRNFPNLLIIFDENVDVNSFRKELAALRPKSAYLFPLSSNWRLIYEIESATKNLFGTNIKIKSIESAELIDKEVDVLRKKVSKWSADLGDFVIVGKSIKEWFLFPKEEVSTWWFSLLSEKNTLKTNVFFRLAQLQTLDKIISSNWFDFCVCSVSEKPFSLAIEMLCKRHSINMLPISSLKRKKSFREEIKPYLNKNNSTNFILKALVRLRIRILRGARAKLVMGSVKNRIKIFDNSILFVSYFPAVDEESAKKGILRNKYAIPLQEKLSEMEKNIIWIWMYVFLDGHSYRDALMLAKKFTKNGEINFLLDEFVSLKVLFRVLALWLRQIRIFLKLKRLIPEEVLYENLSIPEGVIFIKNLMAESFIGWTGLEGILFFELYKKVFSYFPDVPYCIYYTEMHAWAKALNAAKKLKAPQIKSIGFQHTNVSRNFFHYFHHPCEVGEGKSISLPLPNILACNGDIPLSLMARCGYPNIRKVEAIRHLYLSDCLNNPDFSKKEDIVLIAGSMDSQVTRALISLFYEAFSKPQEFKVWLKGHPALPLEQVLKELDINPDNSGYVVKHDPINKLIKVVRIVFVGDSTVALEGLASGCVVILPVFADHMFMSPLAGFEKYYIRISDPAELKNIIERIIGYKERKEEFADIKKFILSYWCLDKSLKRWEKLLK